MSIWASWWGVDTAEHTNECAVWDYEGTADVVYGWDLYTDDGRKARRRFDIPCDCGAGGIRYDGSHRYPDPAIRDGGIDVAFIPGHCHPSVRGTEADDGPRNPYCRVMVFTSAGHATVVLDEAQVRGLRDILTVWLDADDEW